MKILNLFWKGRIFLSREVDMGRGNVNCNSWFGGSICTNQYNWQVLARYVHVVTNEKSFIGRLKSGDKRLVNDVCSPALIRLYKKCLSHSHTWLSLPRDFDRNWKGPLDFSCEFMVKNSNFVKLRGGVIFSSKLLVICLSLRRKYIPKSPHTMEIFEGSSDLFRL